MSKIPSVSEALDESTKPDLGHGRIMKNLHWVIGGVVVGVISLALMVEAVKSERQDLKAASEAERQERIRSANIDKRPESIVPLLDSQQKKAEEETPKAVVPSSLEGAVTPPLPPLPKGEPKPGTYAGMTPPQPNKPVSDAEREELRAAKSREEASRAAPILAIDSGARELAGAKSGGYVEDNGKQMMVVGSGVKPGSSSSASLAEIRQMEKDMQAAQERATQQREHLMRTGGASSGPSPFQQGPSGSPASPSQQTPDARWLAGQGSASESPILTAKQAPSKNMILQGTVLPAVLITEINSDLPGQLTAQITMDVYDSIRGDHLLIPKGSRLVGQYNNDIRLGQERVMAAFKRLILPNGTYVDLQGMSISDAQGQSGVTGDVDNHFWKMFGPSLFSAGLAYLFQRNQGDSNTTVNVYGSSQQGFTSAAGQILVDTSKKITDRTANIPPTITIKQGYKFNVIASRDIVMSPYVRNSNL